MINYKASTHIAHTLAIIIIAIITQTPISNTYFNLAINMKVKTNHKFIIIVMDMIIIIIIIIIMRKLLIDKMEIVPIIMIIKNSLIIEHFNANFNY